MKKRKFVAMTNLEWAKKHKPNYVSETYAGGAFGCPWICGLGNHYKACGLPCKDVNDCCKCWELPAIINGRYILKEVKK